MGGQVGGLARASGGPLRTLAHARARAPPPSPAPPVRALSARSEAFTPCVLPWTALTTLFWPDPASCSSHRFRRSALPPLRPLPADDWHCHRGPRRHHVPAARPRRPGPRLRRQGQRSPAAAAAAAAPALPRHTPPRPRSMLPAVRTGTAAAHLWFPHLAAACNAVHAAVTVKAHGSKGQAEEVPFLFSAKSLAVSGPASAMDGALTVPSYRGSSFFDTIGRGGSTGWDWQKVRGLSKGVDAARGQGAEGGRAQRLMDAAPSQPRPRRPAVSHTPSSLARPVSCSSLPPYRACPPPTRTTCARPTRRRSSPPPAPRALRSRGCAPAVGG